MKEVHNKRKRKGMKKERENKGGRKGGVLGRGT